MLGSSVVGVVDTDVALLAEHIASESAKPLMNAAAHLSQCSMYGFSLSEVCRLLKEFVDCL
jgi:hypothetical protein